MLKKLTLLAMSVAALVAFAVPATASAGWTSSGVPLEEPTKVKLTGHFQFSVFGAFGWTVETGHIELTLESGATGAVTRLEATNCVGILGYSGNTCHVSTQNLPWAVHCNANGTISITNLHLTHKFTGANSPADSTLQGGVTATPDNQNAITKVDLSSAGATSNGFPGTLSGTLNVDAEHSGKIGCI